MNILAAIMYSLSIILLSMIISSYVFAYKIRPRTPILALVLFFISVLLITIVSAIKLWGVILYGHHVTLPINSIRPSFLFFSSAFLLYTTWKRNEV